MFFVFVRGRCIEPGPHITIAKSVDGILTSVDRCHQLPIGVPHRVERSMPLLLTLWLILRSAPYPKVLRLVDRHLVAQHTPLVIKLQRILVEPVLDTHSFTSPPPIRHHRVVDAHYHGALQAVYHLLGLHVRLSGTPALTFHPLQRPSI